MHVAHAVAAHVVNVHVEDVRALALLLAGERDQPVPVLGLKLFPHLLRPRSVDAFADDEERGVLAVRLLHVERRAGGRRRRFAAERRQVFDRLDHRAQVRGRGAAAAADD